MWTQQAFNPSLLRIQVNPCMHTIATPVYLHLLKRNSFSLMAHSTIKVSHAIIAHTPHSDECCIRRGAPLFSNINGLWRIVTFKPTDSGLTWLMWCHGRASTVPGFIRCCNYCLFQLSLPRLQLCWDAGDLEEWWILLFYFFDLPLSPIVSSFSAVLVEFLNLKKI